MRRLSLTLALLTALLSPAAFAAPPPPAGPAAAHWPTLDQQLKERRVRPGTALEKLILANQDFAMLRPEEASDRLPVPLWLRVHWRKHHPEGTYSAADPTGGYPLALKEVAEWMETHQSLAPTTADEWRAPFEDDDEEGAGSPEAASPAPPPGQPAVGRNIRVSGSHPEPRSESDVRINFWHPQQIIVASNNIGASGQQAEYFSHDGGATWGQSFLPLFENDRFHSDPTIDWTSDGTAWSMTMGINAEGTLIRMRSYKSTDGGATWVFDDTFSGRQTYADKEMMWIDHSATSPFKNHIYTCWHNGEPAYVNRRSGPAGSWSSPMRVSGAETQGTGIGCGLATNAAGDAFVFWPATGNRRIVMAKSTDGGTRWQTPVVIASTYGTFIIGVPAMDRRRALIYVSGAAYRTAAVNRVYASWTDLSGAPGCTVLTDEPDRNVASPCKTRVWFARSADGGTTWTAPVKVNDQPSLNDQFNQWLGVDDRTGRLALIYYDTVGGTSRKKSDVWYQTSVDGGANWSAALKLTTLQTDETGGRADLGNQYGDYNSLSIYADRIFPAWTDRRSGTEEIWTAPIREP
jgi:hypothetical protein